MILDLDLLSSFLKTSTWLTANLALKGFPSTSIIKMFMAIPSLNGWCTTNEVSIALNVFTKCLVEYKNGEAKAKDFKIAKNQFFPSDRCN